MQVMNAKTYMQRCEAGILHYEPFQLCDAIGDGEVVDQTDPRFVEVVNRQRLAKLASEFIRACHDEGVKVVAVDLRIGEQHHTEWPDSPV